MLLASRARTLTTRPWGERPVAHPHDSGVILGNLALADLPPEQLHVDAVVSLCRVGTHDFAHAPGRDHLQIWLIDRPGANATVHHTLDNAARAVRGLREEGEHVLLTLRLRAQSYPQRRSPVLRPAGTGPDHRDAAHPHGPRTQSARTQPRAHPGSQHAGRNPAPPGEHGSQSTDTPRSRAVDEEAVTQQRGRAALPPGLRAQTDQVSTPESGPRATLTPQQLEGIDTFQRYIAPHSLATNGPRTPQPTRGTAAPTYRRGPRCHRRTGSRSTADLGPGVGVG